jgi:hypothetical protein
MRIGVFVVFQECDNTAFRRQNAFLPQFVMVLAIASLGTEGFQSGDAEKPHIGVFPLQIGNARDFRMAGNEISIDGASRQRSSSAVSQRARKVSLAMMTTTDSVAHLVQTATALPWESSMPVTPVSSLNVAPWAMAARR